MRFGKRIKGLRERKDLTQTQLARRVELHPSQLSNLENERVPPFQDFTKYSLLAEVLGANAQELWQMGQQDRKEWKAKEHIRKAKILEPKLPEISGRRIPIFHQIPAHSPENYGDPGYDVRIGDDYYEFKVGDPNAFFWRAKGDSMSPYIIKGDLLLISPNDKVESGDIAAVANGKGEKEVRRVAIRKDQLTLTPLNPTYPMIIWEAKDKPKIIGRVKEIIRRR